MPIVADTPRTVLNPIRTTPRVHCCCAHTHCSSFREERWCERVYRVEGTTSRPVEATSLQGVLDTFLPDQTLDYLVTQRERRGTFVHSILLRLELEPGDPGLDYWARSQLEASLRSACGSATAFAGDCPEFDVTCWTCCGEDAMNGLELWAQQLPHGHFLGETGVFSRLVHELCCSGFSAGRNARGVDLAWRGCSPESISRWITSRPHSYPHSYRHSYRARCTREGAA